MQKETKAEEPKTPPKPIQSVTLIEWDARARLYENKNKIWRLALGVITIALAVVFYFISGWSVALLVFSFGMVLWLTITVEPSLVHYQIKNTGFQAGSRHYPWEDLEHFWVGDYKSQHVLYFKTKWAFPDSLLIQIQKTDSNQVQNTIQKYLLFEVQNIHDYTNIFQILTDFAIRLIPKLRFKRKKSLTSS